MTTVAAIQGPGWAVIGSDSRLSEESRMYQLPRTQPKIVKNSGYLIGAAGDLRGLNLLAYTFRPPSPDPDCVGISLDRFISTKFIPSLKRCFEANDYGKAGEHESSIIVVANSVIFDIGGDYEWCHEEEGIYAIGSGAPYALGCLHGLLLGKKRSMTASRGLVRTSIDLACRFDPGSGGPVHVSVQKSGVTA